MSLLDELKVQRESYAECIRKDRAAILAFEKSIATYEANIFDLDRAIAALSPAPESDAPAPTETLGCMEPGSDDGEESDALAEFMKREGAKLWLGGSAVPEEEGPMEVHERSGVSFRCVSKRSLLPTRWAWTNERMSAYDIIAYAPIAVAPSEEGQGEDGASHVELTEPSPLTPFGEGWKLGWAGADRPADPAMIEGYEEGTRDRALGIACGNPHVPNYDGTSPDPTPLNPFEEPEARAGYADDQALIQSNEAIAQTAAEVDEPAQQVAPDLPPLFPPEPPKAATPEQLEAVGVIDPEASFWARKLAKEPA